MATTWLVVADSARARIFTVQNHRKDLEEVKDLIHPESRMRGVDLNTNKPGRTFDRRGPGRHSMSQSVSPKEHEAWKLCKAVADEIETARSQGKFDRLAIVAAPAFLGELRKRLSEPTTRMIVKEINKDISNLDTRNLRDYLPESIVR